MNELRNKLLVIIEDSCENISTNQIVQYFDEMRKQANNAASLFLTDAERTFLEYENEKIDSGILAEVEIFFYNFIMYTKLHEFNYKKILTTSLEAMIEYKESVKDIEEINSNDNDVEYEEFFSVEEFNKCSIKFRLYVLVIILIGEFKPE